MNPRKDLKPAPWQTKAVKGIADRLSGRAPKKAALLQLPTGFGKSLVAASVYQRLRALRPGLILVVVLPRREIPYGWCRALNIDPKDPPEFGREVPLEARRGRVRFETKRTLAAAMLSGRPGKPTEFATYANLKRCLIVVDEIHQHGRVLDALAAISLSRAAQNPGAENRLTTPFRSPLSGRRGWPRWLLLSATPFSPVKLDALAPNDKGGKSDTWEAGGRDDEGGLASEVDRVLSALCELSGLRRGEWLKQHIESVETRLGDGAGGEELKPPARLVIWPRTVKSDVFSPPRARRLELEKPKHSPVGIERATRQLIRLVRAIYEKKAKGVPRWATSERFLLSGGRLKVEKGTIEGIGYCSPLRSCVVAGKGALPRKRGEEPEKLKALLALLRHARGQHTLVFCVHQAVARRVARVIAGTLGEKRPGDMVRCALKKPAGETYAWFNDPTTAGASQRVLVVTDASSESVDLHEYANVLVHYELPWSPLRVLQRVGRLWRLREGEMKEGEAPGPPKLPAVSHFAHPGSVDEEILNRLHRRWAHLKVLGLAFLDEKQGLGDRWPAVVE